MPVGLSTGETYDDNFHYLQSQWDPDTYAPEAPTEAAGALKTSEGSKPQGRIYISPEPSYDTPLTEEERKVYNSRYGEDANKDYDMQGYFKANPDVMPNSEGVHYPDTFKKPNHITFSSGSQYSNDDTPGGSWNKIGVDAEGKDTWSFTPSSFNLKQHSLEDMKKYFKEVEEPNGNKLLPDINDVPRHDWVESVFKSMWSGVTAPGDALAGRFNPLDEEGVKRSMDLAGTMVFAPAPVAKGLADGTLGSFAGVGSKTYNQTKHAQAEVLEAMGTHPDDIWDKTGFFRGADSKWRYEIPDNTASLRPENMIIDNEGRHAVDKVSFLEEVLTHPELYKAYPKLKDLPIFSWEGEGTSIARSGKEGIWMTPMHPQEFKDILLHEIQHQIQNKEGFELGGNPASFLDPKWIRAKKVYDEHVANGADKNHPEMQKLGAEIDAAFDKAFEQYEKVSGEVEARNVELRSNLSDRVLKARPPYATEDVYRHQQIPSNVKVSAKVEAPETVKSAAIRYKDETFEGLMHAFALDDIEKKYGVGIPGKDLEEGFTTSKGRFISREEAYKLAEKNEQIRQPILDATKDQDNAILLSEDLKGVYDKILGGDLKDHVYGNTEKRPPNVTQMRKAANDNFKAEVSAESNPFTSALRDFDNPPKETTKAPEKTMTAEEKMAKRVKDKEIADMLKQIEDILFQPE